MLPGQHQLPQALDCHDHLALCKPIVEDLQSKWQAECLSQECMKLNEAIMKRGRISQQLIRKHVLTRLDLMNESY